VIQAGRAGLTLTGRLPGESILIGDVPRDWLFPGLAAAIRDATSQPTYRDRARDLASRIAGENGTAPVTDAVSCLPG
jgi:hypothetical protein